MQEFIRLLNANNKKGKANDTASRTGPRGQFVDKKDEKKGSE